MKRYSYREQDYAFGQIMLTLRTALKLTQTELATTLGVSRNTIAVWEAGNKYPKVDHLKALIAYAVEHQGFSTGGKAEEIRAFWKAAHQKVLLDEQWLAALLASAHANATPFVTRPTQIDAQTRPEPPNPTSRLPIQPTEVIGRNAELSGIAHILRQPECRLLTLLGLGGVGKTSLALAVAANQAAEYKNGAVFVPLESIGTTSQIVSAIGDALDLSFAGQRDPMAYLTSFLRDQQLLLILDNFEHLLAGTLLVYELLQQAPALTILITSQVRLNLRAEWLFDVGGLAYPSQNEPRTEAGLNAPDATQYAAVQLFIQRAIQVKRDFSPSEAALASIVHICQQVSGMPLAIELAAASVRTLSVADIEVRISENLDLLATNLRDIPLRHRSLRATFDYSWSLLSEIESALLNRLAVFRGGFSQEAAQEITGADLPMLLTLVDRSLLRQSSVLDSWSAERFSLLEPTRAYALEKLAAAGEIDQLRHKHAVYYLELAETAVAQWDSPQMDAVIAQIDQEHDNMRAALQWARDSGSILGLQLMGSLWRFWRRGSLIDEARAWLDELLLIDNTNTDTSAVLARTRALDGAGWLATDQGDLERAAQLFEQAKALRESLKTRRLS